MSTQIRSETRAARKPYRCEYCAGRIQVGERHAVWAWADGGRISQGRGHSQCVEMHDELSEPWHDDELMDWGEFRDMCREELNDRRPFPWETPA